VKHLSKGEEEEEEDDDDEREKKIEVEGKKNPTLAAIVQPQSMEQQFLMMTPCSFA